MGVRVLSGNSFIFSFFSNLFYLLFSSCVFKTGLVYYDCYYCFLIWHVQTSAVLGNGYKSEFINQRLTGCASRDSSEVRPLLTDIY